MNELQPSSDQDAAAPPPSAHAQPSARPPPDAFLDGLQEPMEAIALGRSPNHGRFCAYCYARLSEPSRRRPSRLPASRCEHCETASDELPAVHQVPEEVLAIYMAKRRREGLIVNLFAFLGIFLALVVSAGVWLITPDNLWKIAPFAVLILGAYYLARVIGYNAGVPLGSSSGCRLRNQLWSAYDAARAIRGTLTPALP